MPRRRALLPVAATAAGLVLAAVGCGGDDVRSDAGQGTEVTIRTFMYEPDPLTVDAGTTVTFVNEDNILHTVTSGRRAKPTKDFDEDLDGAGTTAAVTFDEAGTIDYFCDIHQGMDGQVIVE